MGMRFIKVHLDSVKRLGGYYPAAIMFEYLRSCQNNPYITKDADGYFERSSSAIEDAILLRRTVQEKARRALLDIAWIRCKLSSGQSPTLMFKVVDNLPKIVEK